MQSTPDNETCFGSFLKTVRDRKTYFDGLCRGNNGDVLIVMGAKHILKKTGCKLVNSPKNAEQIIIRGSGSMVDIHVTDFKDFVYYRKNYHDLPLIIGPSTYRFPGANFRKVCEISSSPFIFFARDRISSRVLSELRLPKHCDIRVSHDLAFELRDSDFIENLVKNSSEKHILIAMRKDKEGVAGLLVKMRGTWLPKRVRRPLSWVRDRMVARVSRDAIEKILEREKVRETLPRIYRDVSTSVSFEEFVVYIRDAALIITNRLHVAVLGHLLNKRVVLICSGEYHRHKIRGVYELSMSGAESRTRLYP